VERAAGFAAFTVMSHPRQHARGTWNAVVIALLVFIAAIAGGLVARFLPLGTGQVLPPQTGIPPLGSTDLTVAPLVRKVAPAVVNIAVLQPSPALQNPLLRDPFFRQYVGIPDSALQPTIAAGSGVIVDSKHGLVVTNFHVVENASAVEVGLYNGHAIRAQVLGVAPKLDLAVLKVGEHDLPSLPLGDSSKLSVGDYVLAIGNPFGLGQTVTSGIVSALNRTLGQNDDRRFIQTDAPINPGNSGGALIDTKGEVVGINSALLSPSGQGNVGIGFAIPSNVVRKVVTEAEKSS
jgi:S1-C subfamily serine protease